MATIPQINSIPVVLDLYKYRSTILRERGDFEQAINICNEGIEIARRNRIQSKEYLELINILGSIYLKEKKFDLSLQRFEMVFKLDPDFNSPRRHLDAHTYLGMLYSYQNEWNSADYHLTKSIEIGRKVSDIFRLAKALIVQGGCLFNQQKFGEAVPYYQEAVDLSGSHGFKQRQFTALLKLTNCFVMMKKNEEIVKCN